MIRFISAQQATTYFVWQIEVLLNNFQSVNIDLQQVDVLCALPEGQSEPDENWLRLSKHYNARFFFYKDDREDKSYLASIKPYLLKVHYKENPSLQKETIFLHDADMIFTRKIDFSQFTKDDFWYGSDCGSYLGYNYILSKGQDVVDLMCSTCSIDKTLVMENEFNSIGAQYVIKDVDWEFWDSVERSSVDMHKKVTDLNALKKIENPDYFEVQIWCSEMWALIWEAWKRGKKTICHEDLKFSWGTYMLQDWDLYPIFHNAGVVASSKEGFFFKGDYVDKLPYFTEQNLNPNLISVKYWELIEETARKTVLK